MATSAANGTLPGRIEDGWVAHYEYHLRSGGLRRFTVVVAHVPKSIGFAARMLCHDRGLDEGEMGDPEEDAEVIKLDDRPVVTESEALLARYRVTTDHDQDPLRVWQLFSPALIHWLAEDAPSGFSFELQEGGLCCFVPETLETEERLDELCAATKRVLTRVRELGEAIPPAAAGFETRDAIVDAEVARVRFASPPQSVFGAARRFGWWGLITGRSWRLGNEAFFRAQAARLGFRPITEAEFRAGHFDTAIPGEITQVAAGRLEGLEHDAFLLFTKAEDDYAIGWYAIVVEVGNDANTFQFAGMPETEAAEAKGIDITGGNGEQVVWQPDAMRRRSAERCDAFIAGARELLIPVIAAGRPRD